MVKYNEDFKIKLVTEYLHGNLGYKLLAKHEEDSKKARGSLADLVKEADETVVRNFLTSILTNDEKLLNRFKSALKCEISPEDMTRYKNQINGIFSSHAGSHGFIDYYSAGQFATELEEFLADDISQMVENEQYLEEILFENFKEEAFLAEKLVFTEQQVRKFKKEEDSWSRRYSVGRWTIKHIAMLEEQNAAAATIDAYCEKHLEFNEVRKYYIERCMNKKAYDKAIHLLEEGKQVDKDSPGLVKNYSLQLKNIYRQTGNNQAYEKELWSLVLEYQKGNLDIFNELKTLYSEEEWEKQREIIFKRISPYTDVTDLYESEKLYDRLLLEVLESPNLYTLQAYEKSLKKLYPQELFKKYEMVVRGMASHTSNRKRYQEIVTILKRMQKYPEGKRKVEEIVNEWRSIYRNRRAMMDELSKL